ncbi:hypothetical protein N7541_005114 [Penicillium brevicompactum]|uniref:Uncharacterized protein n=1 Tax=Penicillium brevicompactum TaxID=5074 RepID=A0A9W9UX21_PENBR|nr:hypothetical protein N7541_005114 [Penicillium brevicompactum]
MTQFLADFDTWAQNHRQLHDGTNSLLAAINSSELPREWKRDLRNATETPWPATCRIRREVSRVPAPRPDRSRRLTQTLQVKRPYDADKAIHQRLTYMGK